MFKAVPAAAIVMQGLLVTAGHAADTRASGAGLCEIYETAGTVAMSFENCVITSHVYDNWSRFNAEGFEAEYSGDAMEDSSITQNGETYTRTDNEERWCYEASGSDYKICFTPSVS